MAKPKGRVIDKIVIILVVLAAIWAFNLSRDHFQQEAPVVGNPDDESRYVCRHNTITADCSCWERDSGEKAVLSYQECVEIAARRE